MQWALLLLLNVDTFESMRTLSMTHQTSIDITPYFLTYNIRKSKKILLEDMQCLDTLKEIMVKHVPINLFQTIH